MIYICIINSYKWKRSSYLCKLNGSFSVIGIFHFFSCLFVSSNLTQVKNQISKLGRSSSNFVEFKKVLNCVTLTIRMTFGTSIDLDQHELLNQKTINLHVRKQRRRSAVQ